ncbi:MAG: aryl-sulfate sulfohydrolase [Verrucomicrobiaceae bacterium]|nr:MAG: aryl-sulfate sulfohydrolase [Verrucomicrobiaceae bacterium]
MRLIASFLLLFSVLSKAKEDKPNILFIYLDDFGWRDTSYAGSDFYETPNIDSLAKGGMVFSNAYAGAANCAPSRACLLSGQYSPRHKIYNVGTGPRGKSVYRRLIHIAGTNTLSPEISTWAKVAKEAGYATASIGKWHLSSDPTLHGFDLNIGGSKSGSPPKGYFPPHGKIKGLTKVDKNEYLTDTLTSEAIKFINKKSKLPWLLYLTHFAVHTPIQAKNKDKEYFENKPSGKLHKDTTMAAMIKSVDDGVGKIITTLNSLGIKEKTVIIFYSDNGGYGPATSMHPLKGYKGTYYEGGIRVPFFINWPKVVRSGSKCETPITAVDLYPTICEITGGQINENHNLDGISLVPLLKEKEIRERSLYWHFPAYLQSYQRYNEQPDPLFRARPCGVIRKGKWKLIEYFEDGRTELFNLENDISESKNLSTDQPEIVSSLLSSLRKWRHQVKAPVPTQPNPKFDEKAEQSAIDELHKRNRNKK